MFKSELTSPYHSKNSKDKDKKNLLHMGSFGIWNHIPLLRVGNPQVSEQLLHSVRLSPHHKIPQLLCHKLLRFSVDKASALWSAWQTLSPMGYLTFLWGKDSRRKLTLPRALHSSRHERLGRIWHLESQWHIWRRVHSFSFFSCKGLHCIMKPESSCLTINGNSVFSLWHLLWHAFSEV